MPEVHHPAFYSITREIPADRLADHLAAGWVQADTEEIRVLGNAEPVRTIAVHPKRTKK